VNMVVLHFEIARSITVRETEIEDPAIIH